MRKDKFEIRQPVKVITKLDGRPYYMQLPDECLFFGDSLDDNLEPDGYLILWHGTVHRVSFGDVYTMDNPITEQDKNNL